MRARRDRLSSSSIRDREDELENGRDGDGERLIGMVVEALGLLRGVLDR